MSEKKYVVNFPGGKRVDVDTGKFIVKSDVPEKLGGDDSEPTNTDIFFASIAGCAGYYVREFCVNRGYPVEGLEVEMTTRMSKTKRLIDLVTIDCHMPPGFPEKYKKAIIRSVNSCFVKKHFVDVPEFDTRVHMKM